MPILRHVWFGVLPKLLKIVDALYEQVYHGHENPLPLSSLNDLLRASKKTLKHYSPSIKIKIEGDLRSQGLQHSPL